VLQIEGEDLLLMNSKTFQREWNKEELTTRLYSSQNGVVEHKNRTIVEMVWSMIKAKGLPNSFWVGLQIL
jgi:hypothetical protein